MSAVLDGHGGPHVFVGDLAAPTLDPADRHHLERVVRLRPGDPLTVGDGHGSWRPCRFGDQVEPVGEISRVPMASMPLTVAFALVKGSRPEWVTQKLTELGIDTIVPFTASRSVVRWDDRRTASNLIRLTKVAREASMQCRRAWLPTIEPLRTFDNVASRPGAVLTQLGAEPLGATATTVLIGPEGGWSDDELAQVIPRASIGIHVLRSETAAIAAGTLLTASRAGLT